MSAIGRLFLVLNLILAAVFLGSASTLLSNQADYKQKYDDEVAAHAATQELLDTDKADMLAEINTLKTSNAALMDERDSNKDLADRNASDLAESKRNATQLAGDVAKMSTSFDGLKSSLDSLESAKDAAVAAQRTAEQARDTAMDERDAAVAAQGVAEESARRAEEMLAAIEKSLNDSKKTIASLESEIGAMVSTYGVERIAAAVPKIDAAVLQVDYSLDPGLVALNKGANDGVKRGFVFDIYDSAAQVYKGRAKVENVRENMCSALMIIAPEGTRVKQGDGATTGF